MQNKLVYIALIISTTIFSQNIVVDDQRTAQDLIENVLFNNSGCATISNFSVSGGNFGTLENSFAYFNATGTTFPFQEGIVLSTGKAINTEGPNNNLSDDDATSWFGDIDLSTAVSIPNSDLFNTTILEFDFIPSSTTMSFEYIFASEEYQENDDDTCRFSDAFAFLIKPNGGTYENIALVPNTNIPVSVTNVHGFVSNACPAENENYFGSWNNSNAPINFNGQTAVLTAKKNNLIINQSYHIKLVIADHFNARYDSAVFLKANSFNIGLDLGPDRLIATGNALCNTETLPLNAGTANSYQWYKFNEITLVFDALLSETNQQFIITPALGSGTYKVEATLNFTCISEGEITVEYDTSPTVLDTDLIECVDSASSTSDFNLFDALSYINNDDNTLVIENFYYDPTEAASETNEIPNPNNYTNTSQDEIVIARVRNTAGCISFAEITLKVHQNPKIKDNESTIYCLNDFPNKITLESGFIDGIAQDYTYQWYKDNIPIMLNGANESIQINTIGDYMIEITNSDLCTVSRTITVLPSEIAIFSTILQTENEFYQNRVSLIVEILGQGDYIYAISNELIDTSNDNNFQESNIFDLLLYGSYTLYVKDRNGCGILVKEIHLLSYPKFFTPNNDSKNDTWNINSSNIARYNTVSNILIYNRHGKIMANINPKGIGWNGNYLGQPAPQNSYWFTVDLIDYKGNVFTKKGVFSLEK